MAGPEASLAKAAIIVAAVVLSACVMTGEGGGIASGAGGSTPSGPAAGGYDTHSRLTILYPTEAACPTVGSFFGAGYNLRYQYRTDHAGIDMAVPRGTPVFAVADGVVSLMRSNSEAGLDVWIDHDNVLGLKSKNLRDYVRSQYSHVERPTVRQGQKVKQGEIIAYSGPHWVGDHLHLAMNTGRSVATFINPFLVYAGVLDEASLTSKEVSIPYTDGEKVYPEGGKLIWPVACKPKPVN